MVPAAVIGAVVGLMPVATFLTTLVGLDSYKLVPLRLLVGVVGAGALAAGASYVVNGLVLERMPIDVPTLARYVAPVTEELLKALVVVALIRLNRVAFLVDAAIVGFAAGAGFAIVENAYYVYLAPDAGVGTWIVRGFGTAIMHGGATALFAMTAITLLERLRERALLAFAPALLVACVVHAAYNRMFLPPAATTLVVVLVMPALIWGAWVRGERHLADWLGDGFDADAETIALIMSGAFVDSPAGRYLQSLKSRFDGPRVADLLCYLGLHAELSLRAKGMLMMRENGFDVRIDETVREKLAELDYLEASLGRAGLLALRPLLRAGRRDLWQLRQLRG